MMTVAELIDALRRMPESGLVLADGAGAVEDVIEVGGQVVLVTLSDDEDDKNRAG
jgi:hypothetical protein